MINTESALFDLPFFGMTHAGYEHPIEHAAHQVDDTMNVDMKITRWQGQSQAHASSRSAATGVQGDASAEAGHE